MRAVAGSGHADSRAAKEPQRYDAAPLLAIQRSYRITHSDFALLSCSIRIAEKEQKLSKLSGNEGKEAKIKALEQQLKTVGRMVCLEMK